jgi:hypothetical protein
MDGILIVASSSFSASSYPLKNEKSTKEFVACRWKFVNNH